MRCFFLLVLLAATACGADCPSGTVSIEGSCERVERTRVKTADAGHSESMPTKTEDAGHSESMPMKTEDAGSRKPDLGVRHDSDSTQPMSANGKERMTRGERLNPGENMMKGAYRLAYQADGDLVLYRDGTRVWGSLDFSLSPQTPPGQFAMETDGNVVIRNLDGKVIWRTGTGCFGQYMSLLSDGNVCVYDASDRAVWCSGSIGR